MSNYELVAIISPKADEAGLSKVVDTVTQAISSRGGVMEEIKKWGRRRLAYPIRRFLEADYILARFQLTPSSVKELKKEVDALEDVLRYLVIRVSD